MSKTRVTSRGRRGLSASEESFLAGRIDAPNEQAHFNELQRPLMEAIDDVAVTAAAAAKAALEQQLGAQLPELAEQLMPSGATANVNLPDNAILIGDLL